MNTINYTARLHTTTADGILAHTSELYDEGLQKFQSAINTEVKNRLDGLGEEIGQKISGVYRPKGSKSFTEVMALTPAVGDVYDIQSEFTLNGKKYPAHTNIVAVTAAKGESSWDALGGTVDVQDILTKAAAAADEKIRPVQTAAESAKATAESAKTAAGTATSTATAAQGKAAEAKTAADAATTTANTAKSTAETAKATADTAKATAESAKTTAEQVKDSLYPINEATKNLMSVAFTDYMESMPSGVLMAEISQNFAIVYVAAANCFIAKDAQGKYYNTFARAEYWQDTAHKTVYADKVYWRFSEGRLTPYLYNPSTRKLTAVPSDKEAQLEAALKNKLDAAAFNSYKSTNDAAVQAAQAAGTQAQQAVGKLATDIGGFTYDQFNDLKNRVEALENLLKLA